MEKALILVLFLSGCACKPVIEYVKVPPKEPPVITRPALATDTLEEGDNPGVVIKKFRLTITQLQQWGLELETALDAYRTTK